MLSNFSPRVLISSWRTILCFCTEISILMFKTKLYSDETMPPRHVSKENMGWLASQGFSKVKKAKWPDHKETCRPFWRCKFTTLVGIIPYCFAGWSVCKLNVLINEDCSVHICEACGSISVFFDVKNRWKLDMFLFCWLSTLVFLCLFPDVKIPDVLDLCADCKIVKFSKSWD